MRAVAGNPWPKRYAIVALVVAAASWVMWFALPRGRVDVLGPVLLTLFSTLTTYRLARTRARQNAGR